MGSRLKQIYLSFNSVHFLGKSLFTYNIYSWLSQNIKLFDIFNTVSTFLFNIALVFVLLSLENMTKTNTILTVGIVFQYNISRIVHLLLLYCCWCWNIDSENVPRQHKYIYKIGMTLNNLRQKSFIVSCRQNIMAIINCDFWGVNNILGVKLF